MTTKSNFTFVASTLILAFLFALSFFFYHSQIAQAADLTTLTSALSFSGGNLVSGKFPAVEIKGKTFIDIEVNSSCGTGGCSDPTISLIDKNTGRILKTFANALSGGMIIDKNRGAIEVRLSPNCLEPVGYGVEVKIVRIPDRFIPEKPTRVFQLPERDKQICALDLGRSVINIVENALRILRGEPPVLSSEKCPVTSIWSNITFPVQTVARIIERVVVEIKKEKVEVIKEVEVEPPTKPTPTNGFQVQACNIEIISDVDPLTKNATLAFKSQGYKGQSFFIKELFDKTGTLTDKFKRDSEPNTILRITENIGDAFYGKVTPYCNDAVGMSKFLRPPVTGGPGGGPVTPSEGER